MMSLSAADMPVNHRRLADLGIRNRGTQITAAQMKEMAAADGDIMVFAAGATFALIPEHDLPAEDIVRVPSIIVKSRGHISFDYFENPFTHKSELWSYSIDQPDVNQKFVFYWLLTKLPQLTERAKSTSVKLPQLSVKDTDELLVPLPPKIIQDEIVRILDAFTELEAKLEAELEARRKQYEHYRNQLLTFAPDQGGVRWLTLAEVASVKSGWGFPEKYQGSSQGAIPFFKVSDMNTLGNARDLKFSRNWVSDEVAKALGVKVVPAGTVVFPKIGAAVATNKKRLIVRDSAFDNNVMALIPRSNVLSTYLFHFVQTVNLSDIANDSGAVPSIRKSDMEMVAIPVPDLEEQERIAAILDQFDALVNDISIGLPAEIAARRKQYEYYRNQLLSFDEVPA